MGIKKVISSVKENTSGTFTFIRGLRLKRICICVFLIYISFFDENSFYKRAQNKIRIIKLQKEITTYKNEIERSKDRFNELNSNKENLEKYAREQFLMKKPNEDMFLIKVD